MARALAGEAYTVTEEFGDPALVKPYWEITYSPLRDAEGRIIGAFHFARDITTRLRAEDELSTAQKRLEAKPEDGSGRPTHRRVGARLQQLASEHLRSLVMMQNRMQQGRFNDVERYMLVAQGASKRAAALTHRLLAFSRRQTLDRSPPM